MYLVIRGESDQFNEPAFEFDARLDLVFVAMKIRKSSGSWTPSSQPFLSRIAIFVIFAEAAYRSMEAPLEAGAKTLDRPGMSWGSIRSISRSVSDVVELIESMKELFCVRSFPPAHGCILAARPRCGRMAWNWSSGRAGCQVTISLTKRSLDV